MPMGLNHGQTNCVMPQACQVIVQRRESAAFSSTAFVASLVPSIGIHAKLPHIFRRTADSGSTRSNQTHGTLASVSIATVLRILGSDSCQFVHLVSDQPCRAAKSAGRHELLEQIVASGRIIKHGVAQTCHRIPSAQIPIGPQIEPLRVR